MSKLDPPRQLREGREKGPRRVERLREVTLPATAPKAPVSAGVERAGTGSAGVVGSNPTRSTKRGRPLDSEKGKTLMALQPWKALGLSRRTWYRRGKPA